MLRWGLSCRSDAAADHVALGIESCTGDRAANHVALGIELRIMWFPMLTQNQCRLNVSTYDERPGHCVGLVPCILSLCF